MRNEYKLLLKEHRSRRYANNTIYKDGLYLSVADSDWCFPHGIQHDLCKFIKKRSMNYTFCANEFLPYVKKWYTQEYNFKGIARFTTNNMVIGNGVINFLQLAISAFTKEKDGVIFLSPVYYSFLTAIENLNRTVVKSKLKYDFQDNRFVINWTDLRKKMENSKNKMILLCNPHNPISRSWSKDELSKIIKLAQKNNLYVVSDEIWQDVNFKEITTPIISLGNGKDKLLSVTSFAKTYNLGGAQFGFAISKNIEMMKKIRSEKNKHLVYATDNLTNIIIAISCMNNPGNRNWLEKHKKIIYENYLILKEAVEQTEIIMPKLEATYLCWLDFSKYKIGKKEINKIFINEHIYLEDGSDFCEAYDHCKRINIAISKKHMQRFAEVIIKHFTKLKSDTI